MKKFYPTGPLRITVAFLFLVLSVAAFSGCGGGVSGNMASGDAGEVTYSWQAPTTNDDADHTQLTDLAGYVVYCSTESKTAYPTEQDFLEQADFLDVEVIGNVANKIYPIEVLPTGVTIFFYVAAYDINGNLSALSNGASTVL